ncbi:unnamed protein product [Oppiella nova]|uniref:Cytochrome P450 n=1 Tax=Oppiella nova TaxID=334625 RepID=A0A7R9LHL9_9ACAR|nr:unnamed protein product [Oppiella nova]CAG2163320.1 unnamed protein product [Oppiella nova]
MVIRTTNSQLRGTTLKVLVAKLHTLHKPTHSLMLIWGLEKCGGGGGADKRTGFNPIIELSLAFVRDSEWKRIRTVMTAMFTTAKVKRLTPLILKCVDTMNDNIDNIIGKSNGKLSAPVDVKPLTGAYAMESIINVTFGVKVSAMADPNNPIIENIRKINKQSLLSWVRLSIILLAPYVARMLRLSQLDHKVTQYFRDLTLNLIDERNRVSETERAVKRVDFLQLMLDSMRDKSNETIDGSEEYTDSGSGEKYREIRATASMRGNGLSYDEIVAQCVMFMLAGYDGVSVTISICLYAITKHPEVQQKLYKEIHTFHEQKAACTE